MKVLSVDEKRKQIYEELIYNAYIPQRFKNKTLSNYEPYPKNEDIYEAAKEFAHNYMIEHRKKGNWLLMSGGYGLGKTHLAIGLLKKIAWEYAKEFVERRTDYPVSIITRKENTASVLFQNITSMLQEIKIKYI